MKIGQLLKLKEPFWFYDLDQNYPPRKVSANTFFTVLSLKNGSTPVFGSENDFYYGKFLIENRIYVVWKLDFSLLRASCIVVS